MNWADWAIVLILSLSTLISLARGFIKEAFSLTIWIAAVIIANLFSGRLEHHFTHFISTPSVRAISAFLAVFIVVLLVGAFINYCIGLLVKATGLSGTDRLFGMCFGFLRGLFIVITLLIYVPSYVPVKKDLWFQQSVLIPYFLPYEAAVKNTTTAITRWVLNMMAKPPEVTI